MPDSPRRIGLFTISGCLLRRWEDLVGHLKDFVVVRAEFLYYKDALEVVAYSPLFRVVDGTEEPPKYTITLGKDSEGKIHVIATEYDRTT